MNETNNLGSTANLFGPWANKLTLGLTGNANRMRQNVRTFTVTDKFDFLLKDLNTLRPGDGGIATVTSPSARTTSIRSPAK